MKGIGWWLPRWEWYGEMWGAWRMWYSINEILIITLFITNFLTYNCITNCLTRASHGFPTRCFYRMAGGVGGGEGVQETGGRWSSSCSSLLLSSHRRGIARLGPTSVLTVLSAWLVALIPHQVVRGGWEWTAKEVWGEVGHCFSSSLWISCRLGLASGTSMS